MILKDAKIYLFSENNYFEIEYIVIYIYYIMYSDDTEYLSQCDGDQALIRGFRANPLVEHLQKQSKLTNTQTTFTLVNIPNLKLHAYTHTFKNIYI